MSRLRSSLVALLWLLVVVMPRGDAKCSIHAIFNFGDSNSDTGGFWAAFPAAYPPHGMTFFKKPSGRASDGRLIIDFLAQGLGLPFLSPYLKSIGSDYRHGANFATLASTVSLPLSSLFVAGVSPFSLGIQINQWKNFKSEVDRLNDSSGKTKLPPPDVFRRSLFTFYIGQNDFTGNLASLGIAGAKRVLPDVVSQIAAAIKEIYAFGGRTFMVLNLAPIGCYPSFLVELPHNTSSDMDSFGCMIPYNDAVNDYNSLLNETLTQARNDLPDSDLLYADINSVMLNLFHNPSSHGLKYGTKACCGYGGDPYNFNPKAYCGNGGMVGGRNVSGVACSDPYNYVSWDGIHATEAANKVVAEAILSGSVLYPPFSLDKLCDIQPIE